MSAKKPVKPNKAALSRREALRAQREAEEAKKRRTRLIAVLVGVVVLVILIAVIVWALNRTPATPPATPTSSETPSETANTPLQLAPPDGDAQRAWITVPSANTKADALIVDIQFDYQCPICALLENNYGTTFEALSDSGDIILRYHNRSFLDGPNALNNDSSLRAGIAAACVDYADNTKYAAYHNEIFANQPSQEGTGYTDDQLTNTFTAAVGLTGTALDSFNTCYSGQQTLNFVQDMETNNIQVVANQSPPNNYLFGGNVPNVDTTGGCTGTKGGQAGACGTPDLYVNGTQMATSKLIGSDQKPLLDPTDPNALLTLLKQIANV